MPTAEGNNKGDYLCSKLKDLNDPEPVCVAETHLTDNCENDNETSQEQVKALRTSALLIR